jgi:hypothetical protein
MTTSTGSVEALDRVLNVIVSVVDGMFWESISIYCVIYRQFPKLNTIRLE